MSSGKYFRSLLSIIGLCIFGYPCLEPLVVEAVTDDIIVTQYVDSDIAISSPDDVIMTGTIYGMTGGTGNGSAYWTITTSNAAGFNMSLKADTSPAMKSGSYSFGDYVTGAVPDYSWAITSTDVSEFGYTVEAETTEDLDTKFKDNGADTCGTGSADTEDKCWLGFTTSSVLAVNRTSVTSESGEDETVKFRAQSGSSNFQEEGDYIATITVTAINN